MRHLAGMCGTHRLFVYGSLKRGFRHHGQLEGARPCGPATTERGYRLVLAGGYPALVRGGRASVRGELYLVTDDQLARLDAFEEVPHLYQRQLLRLGDGSEAYGYLLPEGGDEGPVLDPGEWLPGDER